MDVHVGIIGAGAMGGAIASALVNRGICHAERLHVSDADSRKLEPIRSSLCVHTTESNREVVSNSSVVLFAVKPQILRTVIDDLRSVLRNDQLVVSVAAGVSTRAIESWLPFAARVVRAMPNTPGLIGAGVTAVCRGRHATSEDIELAGILFGSLGEVINVDESAMDAVTGLSGSGPAYCYLFIESLAEAGVLNGLPRETALKLAYLTTLGSGMMVKETGEHPSVLKAAVTSPAGTTAAGLSVLEKAGFRSAVLDAVSAAVRRSKELSGTDQ
ncbi:MAG: pyrroline-5-carboxylate reductase [Firmicutes bacterium]|nr:pyrroline-5-carboxylate reductase [Bacillota bacterium]